MVAIRNIKRWKMVARLNMCLSFIKILIWHLHVYPMNDEVLACFLGEKIQAIDDKIYFIEHQTPKWIWIKHGE